MKQINKKCQLQNGLPFPLSFPLPLPFPPLICLEILNAAAWLIGHYSEKKAANQILFQ